MAEDIKNKIFNFLKENVGKEFNVLQIKEAVFHSYPTVLKWVCILGANPESKIIIKDYGHVKIVSYVGEGK